MAGASIVITGVSIFITRGIFLTKVAATLAAGGGTRCKSGADRGSVGPAGVLFGRRVVGRGRPAPRASRGVDEDPGEDGVGAGGAGEAEADVALDVEQDVLTAAEARDALAGQDRARAGVEDVRSFPPGRRCPSPARRPPVGAAGRRPGSPWRRRSWPRTTCRRPGRWRPPSAAPARRSSTRPRCTASRRLRTTRRTAGHSRRRTALRLACRTRLSTCPGS